MWHAFLDYVDWRAILTSAFVGVGTVSFGILFFYFKRMVAAHDDARKAREDWEKSVDADRADFKQFIADSHGGETGEANGVDKRSLPGPRRRGRIRES